jgi:RNA polymerase sigma-70 factor (ECF subfamily)
MRESTSSDEVIELVDRAKAGDVEAWDRLYAIYEEDVRKRVRSKLGPSLRVQLDESTDIMQSVWREAIKSLKGFEYRGDGSFLAWVTTILRHKVARRADAAHRNMHSPGAANSDFLAAHADDRTGPTADVRNQEDLRLLRLALQEMDDEKREVLQLSWFEGMKHREVGDRLGITEDAARMRVTRAESELVKAFRRLHGESLP